MITFLAQKLSENTGIGIRNIFLGIIGTFAVILVVGRGLAAYADEKYGRMVTAVLAAVPIFGMAYFPDQTSNIFKGLWSTFFGG